MIGRLRGQILAKQPPQLLLDVGGVGYMVHCSSRTLSALGNVGEGCTVHTDLQVSETDMRLLGFANSSD